MSETAERAPSFRLGEAVGSGAPGVATAERPSAELLSETEARRVLDRLPPLPDPPRAVPFARREDSLPAPRAGRTVEVPFPPAASAARPDAAAAGPLEVLRRAPEGDVALAPTLSVTFSQPMVALDTQDALGRETVPVRLEPKVPGEWRWVGARTVVFQPEGRFPMATEFRAAVPAGTSSATGGILARDVAWSFATPPPRVVARHPDGAVVRRDAIVFVAFDQDVNPPAVLASTHARAAAATVALRLATEAEVANDAAVARLVKDAARGRWVALAPTAPFPPDAAVEVSVGPGTPSAEGKRRTSESQSWSFRTYGPFRVKSHECGGGGRCTPLAPWRIETTNPVDPRSLRPDLVRVSPELPGLKLSGWGSQLVVNGMSKGRTTYGVTLSPEIRDAFGQPLEESAPMTFAVGRAEPSLAGPRGEFVVLDPAGPRRVPVYSVGHAALRARVFAVTPSDWPAWHKYRQASWRDESAVPPGRAVVDATVRVEGAGDELVETAIDLAPALADGVGQAVVVVEPVSRSREARRQAVRAWVQSTRLGLDALVDGESLLAWATALADGRPQEGVEVSLAGGATARTDAAGLARLALPDTAAPLLVARLGRDVAVLPSNAGGWSEGQGYRRVPFRDALRYFVFDDRKMYRPGEEARLKGWVRRVGTGPRGDVEPAPAGLDRVSWALRDSRGNEVGRGESRLSATGAFDLTLKLPATMNLGPASVLLAAPGAALEGSQHAHALQVQEFRRPEFEVKAQSSEGPHVSAGHATVSVSATYYAGGALPDADVSWRVVSRPGHFRPPNRDEFTFGTFVPWWRPWPGLHEPAETATFAGRTDSAGVHRVRIDFDPQPKPRPRQVEAEATVMDVNRQAWAARAPLLVHPALHYVGLRAERPFVRKGESLELDVVVTDLDGRAVAGRRVALRAERLDWEQIAGEWKEVPKDAQERSLDSGPEPTRVRFEAREGGSWRVVARVSDEAGRANETEMPLWVAGGRVPPRRDLDEETVTIVPDRREYRRGDVARLLVLAPFAPAEALVTLRRSGLVREQRLRIEEASKEIEVPVEEGFTPNVHVNVALVGQAARDAARPGAPTRPAFASGTIDLPVPPLERTLAVDVRPREAAIAPGGETVIDLALRDAAGRPAGNAEATVVVVDEAVLALTGYQRPDPLGVFYAHRDDAVSDHRLRRDVILASPEDLAERMEGGVPGGVVGGMVGGVPMEAQAMAAPAPMAARTRMAKDEAAPEPIRARTDFAALALFAATLPTDADGRARVSVKLPDSLTRYRVMAVAASGARQFGSAEATLVARLPLMVRPSPPRFLNFGDRFDLPVVVQNQTDRAMTVDVAVRARNAVLTAGSGRRLSVPANDRAEVRFPMAAVLPGSARVQVGAASGGAADAAEVELPVWTPATTEAFATYGQVDAGSVAQPVKAPANVEPSVGGLEVTTSSTALQALTDAVLYLVAYPFECAEQLSSRVLAVAALRDVLAAFGAEGLPKPGEIEVAVRRDLDRLRALQNDDGGFGFWRRGDESWPYVSIHVANALARARAKGFEVPAPMLERSHGYLRDIDRHIPSRYPRDVKRTLRAYALHVRALLGAADPAAARGLVREAGVEGLSFEALGFVLPVLAKDGRASAAEVAAIRRRIANGVTETAGGAHFTVSYEDGAHLLLHSDRRADAILLEALVADQPGSDVIPKLATGLLAHRTAGRWTNTQENVFVLLALDRYFQAYEKTTPDFVARAWLGERYAGEQPFRGRSTDRRHVVIPMTELGPAGSTSDLVLAKDGPGRLYYRIGLRYAPRSLVLDPLDRGFTIERAYQGLDDAKDVRRESDGTWRIRAGARVRVVLTMIAPARRYHVALVDPLPAGLEAVNPALAVAERVPEAGGSDVVPLGATGLGGRPGLGSWRWWSRPWFDHQNLRDERVEAFSSLLWEGVHEYRYVARATTPGTFVVPPTKVEEMYAPETFGRSRTDRVVVE